MKISPEIVETYIKYKQVRALALSCVLKSVFSNGIIYNYSPIKLSSSLAKSGVNIDHRTLKKWITVLIDEKHADVCKGNLRMKSIKGAHAIKVDKIRNLKEAETCILGMFFKYKASQQKYVQAKKDDCVDKRTNPRNAKEYRNAKKLAVSLKIEDVQVKSDGKVRYSVATLCNMLNCSTYILYGVLRRLREKGELHVNKNIVCIGRRNATNSSITFDGGFVSKKGYIYSVECNTYCFTEKATFSD